MKHLALSALDAGLQHIRAAPADAGLVVLIVRRPAENQREVLEEGTLSLDEGLVGDSWSMRGSPRTPDGRPHPDMQLNLMNARVATLVAADPERMGLAGDQLYIDLDLSEANLPLGTRLALGETVVEITEQPHLGCKKFAARFGQDALRWVNSPQGRVLRLRGVNAKVVVPGTVRRGDRVCKLLPSR